MNFITQRRKRQSGIELLRIIAMFLVLVVHASFSEITYHDLQQSPLSSFTRIFFQSLSIGCVDIFVLITGWFGIRPKRKSFFGFVFQCAFFLFGIYAFCLATGLASFSMKGIAECLLFRGTWFVKAYILLYILAPLLNAFIDSASERQHRLLLIYFFLFQTIYSWASFAVTFFEQGYSTMSFIALYLLARYFSIYKPIIGNYNKNFYLAFYFLSVILLATTYFLTRQFQIEAVAGRIIVYDQPLVIAASLSLVLYFSKLDFQSAVINGIAASSFAVYLLHSNPNLFIRYYISTIKSIYSSSNGIICLGEVLLFLLFVFTLAILIDQIRIWLWNYCYRK